MQTTKSSMWEVPQNKWPDFLTNICQGKNNRILQIKRLKELNHLNTVYTMHWNPWVKMYPTFVLIRYGKTHIHGNDSYEASLSLEMP